MGDHAQHKEETVFEKLRKIAEAYGGAILHEFEELVSLVNQSEAVKSRLDELHKLLGKPFTNVTKVSPIRKSMPTHSRGSKRRKCSTSRLPLDTIIPIQIMLLRARAKDDKGKALEKAYKDAARRLGIIRRKNWRKVIGRFMATTQGKFRKTFLARVARLEVKRGGNFIKRSADLAIIYSKIEGKKVLASTLYDEGLKRS